MPLEKDTTYSDQGATIGEHEEPQHRAAAGEGNRAPSTAEGADHAEFSIFDGRGNENVAVVADDDEGRLSEGTGPSSAEALADAKSTGDRLGEGFFPHE